MIGSRLFSVACILAALLAFALLIESAGFLPAVFVATFFAMLAERPINWLRALVYSTLLTVMSYGVFVAGLGLPVKAFG